MKPAQSVSLPAVCALLVAVRAAAGPVATNTAADVARTPGPERKSLRTVSPVYPAAAIEAGLEGSVIVCFSVDADGKVSDPVALTSTHPVFEAAALSAAAANAFAPVPSGAPLNAHATCLRYRFRL